MSSHYTPTKQDAAELRSIADDMRAIVDKQTSIYVWMDEIRALANRIDPPAMTEEEALALVAARAQVVE